MDKTKMPREKGARKRPGERWLGSDLIRLWGKQRWGRRMKKAARVVASGSSREVILVEAGGKVHYIDSAQLQRLVLRGVVPRKDLVRLVEPKERAGAKKGVRPLRVGKQEPFSKAEEKMPKTVSNDPDPFEALFEKWRHGVEAVSPEQEVQQWLAEKKKLGKKHYELVLNLGDDEGKKTLRELVEGERWDEALQIIHRVDHW